MWIMYVAFSALGLFISLFIAKNKLSKEHTTVKTGLVEEERLRKEAAEKKKLGKEQLAEENAAKDAEKMENRIANGEVAEAKV